MPKNINPIKKARVKQALLQGKSARQALKEGNYTQSTIHRSTMNKSVKVCLAEIKSELKANEVTVDMVIMEIDQIRQLALNSEDYSTAGRMAELKGKYLAMWKDRAEIDHKILYTRDEEQELITVRQRLNSPNSISTN